jgi:hypothetical protein
MVARVDRDGDGMMGEGDGPGRRVTAAHYAGRQARRNRPAQHIAMRMLKPSGHLL